MTADDDNATGATKREGHADRSAVHVDAKLSRGTLVGRYVVVDVLGEGGMGIVYAAYDPELDRKVAIKLLQARPSGGSSSHGDQAWLMREAQALARLAHPNVTACHDVGTLPGDRVYVAMELVEGLTLRAWIKQSRTWRDVRKVMLEAGAGLAAAHRSSLIHRDFKPDNVLVGNDGRVRVMDFGLARLQPADEAPAARTVDLQIEASSPLSESLTIAGSVVGTPAYMAPEIFDGVSASVRSDQFAFGVTLYELLFLQRPYDKRAFAPSDRPRSKDLKPRDPPKVGVPQRLQRVAMRAISIDPDARFASMDGLLAELAIDPMATRRRVLAGIGGAGVVTAAVITTMTLSSASDTPDQRRLCTGAARNLAGVWDPTVKQAVRAAFEKTDKPFKAKAFAAIESTLDKYAAEWTTAVTESCEATKLTGVQTEDVQSLRQDCFDQRLAIFRSFTGLLVNADDPLVDKAANAALAFEREEPVRRCADVVALKAPAQPSAEMRPRVLAGEAKLADARAGILTGNFGRAINAAREALKLATAIPFDPLIASASLVLGASIIQLGGGTDAKAALAEATWAGLRSRRDDIAAEAALYNALATGRTLDQHDEAKIWLEVSRASLIRAGRPGHLEVALLGIEGILRSHAGDAAGAVAFHTKAVARALEVYGKNDPQLAQSESHLAASLAGVGDWAAALPHYQRALDLAIKWIGSEHPDLAPIHAGLGTAYNEAGDLERARPELARALEIRERAFGANSPNLLLTLNNTADVLRKTDPTAALAISLRAKKLVERVGPGHPHYPIAFLTYGEILHALKRLPEARATIDEAIIVAERTKSIYLGIVLVERARIARSENEWARSVGFDQRAIVALEASAGSDNAQLWRPLTGLALARIRDKKFVEARTLLERALAIATRTRAPEATLREVREAFARLPPKN